MPQLAIPPAVERDEWIVRVRALVEQVAAWSAAEGWPTTPGSKSIAEDRLGAYELPTLEVDLPAGQLLLNPIAFQAAGAEGRVDLEAIPTLSRVKLLGRDGEWRILTDSHVWLRMPWTLETFKQIAADMLS